tara:strand:+ start:140 stop:340 length:201 start_codon:yes stop_codon:yes gene_type:complete
MSYPDFETMTTDEINKYFKVGSRYHTTGGTPGRPKGAGGARKGAGRPRKETGESLKIKKGRFIITF